MFFRFLFSTFAVIMFAQSVLALNYGIPTYDSSDTWIKFNTHYKSEKVAEYPFIPSWAGSGTRIGNFIITNAHVVCSPTQSKNIWLSFPDRLSFLQHHELPLNFPTIVQDEFKICQSDVAKKTYPAQALQTLNEKSVSYDIYLPNDFVCDFQDQDTRYDIAILKPSKDSDVSFFSETSKVNKIDCTLPTKGKLSYIIAGGVRDFGLNHPAYPPVKHQTSIGAFELIDPEYYIDTYPFGWMNAGYRSAQLHANPKLTHTFFTGYFNHGDSGSGFFQTDCTKENHFECLNKFFKNKLITIHTKNEKIMNLDEQLQKFLTINDYYFVMDPTASFSADPFWGIVSAGDTAQNTFAPTFYENRKFLRDNLPKEILSDSCFID